MVDDQYFEGRAKDNTNVLTLKRIFPDFCVLLLIFTLEHVWTGLNCLQADLMGRTSEKIA